MKRKYESPRSEVESEYTYCLLAGSIDPYVEPEEEESGEGVPDD